MNKGYSIEQGIATYPGETEDMHRFQAVEDGRVIGSLYADIDRQIIMNVEVEQDRRGEGIARALYEAADEALDSLKHAPAAACTPEGLRFAQAMGGEVADDMDELDTYHDVMDEEI